MIPHPATDGLLLVDKPAGVTSHDVVNAARRALGEKRIGHGGTLDPFATGLLVLLVGRATRLLRWVHDEPKHYEATVRFGAETDTEDLGGTVTREAPLPARAALESAAATLIGEIDQVPPAYSAKRVGGRRAYDLAREGREVALAPVRVRIDALRLSAFAGTDDAVSACRMDVTCGGGTYVRSLARDLARASGSAAHLTALRRTRAGIFDLARAIPFERLREGHAPLAPAIDALQGFPVQALTADEHALIVRGIDVASRVEGPFAALVDPVAGASSPALVAFAERRPSERGDRWQPRVVMRDV
ncbi:MAG: tRNA pseudouridine(55) synthase TruB [Gemmatimonadetes bacterium]|nr:tRNA pseudouridine(55) synthase TruB [Gemmatimonadota bacterium]